ncbi:MAG: restriction endonuclease subunit S [Aeriscardovia sp.]|nr:restriction endonuclease subunit S [Aeriscardovia sp.]
MQMFKNFYLKDIFGDKPIRGTRLTKENRISGNIPLVTAGEQNEGIAEYISNSENQTLSNMLTIDMFGNCFYRDYLYKSDDNILSFGLNGKSTEEMLYIASIINSICKKQYSYVRQYRKSSYLETTIPLPVIESSDPDHGYTPADIDWQYMERYITELEQERIAELEQERIAELDAYLAASGLDDYELTDEDKEILSLSLQNPHLTKQALRKLITGMGR